VANALLKLLGPEYEAAARRTHALYERECAGVVEGVPGARLVSIPIQIYHCLPWLFSDLFPEAADDDLCRVGAAGLLYFGHVLILDRALDGDRVPNGAELLVGSFMHERALTLLFPRLPAETEAWRLLARYAREYAAAVIAEKQRQGRAAPLSWERFAELASGKAAILKASPAMVACIAGRAERVGEAEAFLAPFSVAAQVEDDLSDWRADYAARHYGYLLTRALEVAGADGAEGARPPEEEVGHALFYSDVAAGALERAVECCTRSAELAAGAGAARWARFAGMYGARLRTLASGFAAHRTRGLATPAAAAGGAAAALDRLVGRLAQEHALGYPEARHTMRFPRELGFSAADDVHHGDVFPRAVLGWLYHEMERAGRALPGGMVDENLKALLCLRPEGEAGGWSYFPTLPELAPDSDDLAQVMHAAAARPSPGHDAAFAYPIRLVLDRHPAREDGAVETWIVDPAAPEHRRERYHASIERLWGRGADAEVVANLFAALYARDPVAYGDAARAGTAFVASCQGEDGSWGSTWYVGPFYGAFAACRLLRAVQPGHPALGRALAFLRRTQRPDGGWAADGTRSDALSTALALLALLEAGESPLAAAVVTAVRHLVLVQRQDGLWPRAPFIRMDMNRAAGREARYVTYGSATMSAAFAGAALVRAAAAGEAA
jgi:squalene-hopene/tetraprenyl-beta-curcumene cyclase